MTMTEQDVALVFIHANQGFIIETFSNPELPDLCRYCDERLPLLFPDYPCEFPTPLRGCSCNSCLTNRMGIRPQGAQPVICGSFFCKKMLKREQNQRAYQKRKAAA